MNIDESETKRSLLLIGANTACNDKRRQLEDALSISGAHAKKSGANVEVSGSTKTAPPQPFKVVLSPGQENYELALDCAKAFEEFERLSRR